MVDLSRQVSPLLEIEARQNEVLRQLEELNLRVEQTLAELTNQREPGSAAN